MPDVIRWGQSAYETDADLALERAAAAALGLSFEVVPETESPELAGARALVVTSRVRVDAALIARFEGELVLTTTSGFEHVDVEACRRRRIAVARCPEARRDAVVEQALAQGMALMRRLPALERAAGHGRWARGELPALAPIGLAGATVAILGLGVIGRRTAELCRALGARVLGVDPRGGPPGLTTCGLDTALEHADLLTVHCSLTPSSRGLLDAAALDRLRPEAVVVNTARGEVLDVEAAVARVADGRLRGLAVDVFPVEPYPALARGAAVPGVAFTPHSAGFTRDLGARVAREVAANLGAWRRGDALPGAV